MQLPTGIIYDKVTRRDGPHVDDFCQIVLLSSLFFVHSLYMHSAVTTISTSVFVADTEAILYNDWQTMSLMW